MRKKASSNEIWKKVPGYEIYEASTLGRIRSTGILKRPNRKKDNIVKQRPRKRGYLECKLSLNGKTATKLVHRIILETFSGPAYGKHVNHKDGDKTNNRLDNLEWVTEAENKKHAAAIGLMSRGERRYNSKLSAADIIKIRELFYGGALQKDIATKFGIDQPNVSRIVRKLAWKHV